jgi:hypothetical protein
MKPIFSSSTLSLALLATATISGCSGGASTGTPPNQSENAFRNGLPPTVRDGDKLAVTDTNVDYMSALRSAAIKLTGNYPTLTEIQELRDSPNQPMTYAARIDDYMSRPTFAQMQVSFWRNTFHMGAGETVGTPTAMMDNAPFYAASLVVSGAPFTNVVTATSGTCPTFNAVAGTFTAANCPANGTTVGVLSDQGMNQQFVSSLAFRRARWVQETFMCQRFPAEQTGTPIKYPGGTYNSPWPWNSISGKESLPSARVDFQDQTLICANCHSTLNHLAPLFGKFNSMGLFVNGAAYQVITPLPGNPASIYADWLPTPTEVPSWRFMKPTPDLPSLGAAIAADPGFGRCVVSRVWNWAMSRGDVVNDGTVLTDDLANPMAMSLAAENYNVKNLIKRVFIDPNFVRF